MLSRGYVGVPCDYMRSELRSQPRILPGIGADIEHARRPSGFKNAFDKLALLLALLRRIVVGGFWVGAPMRLQRSRRQLAQRRAQRRDTPAMHVERGVRPLLQLPLGAAFRSALKKMGESHKGEKRFAESRRHREVGIKIARLIAISTSQAQSQRPAQVLVSGQGKKKCAHELPISLPERILQIARLRREHIYEDRIAAPEQDIER